MYSGSSSGLESSRTGIEPVFDEEILYGRFWLPRLKPWLT